MCIFYAQQHYLLKMKPTVKLQEGNSSCSTISLERNLTDTLCALNGTNNLLKNPSGSFLCIAGLDGKFRFVNSKFCLALGYSRTYLLSKPYVHFIHPEDIQKTIEEIKFLVNENKNIYKFRNRYIRSNGKTIHLEWMSTFDAHKNRIFATAKEISQETFLDTEEFITETQKTSTPSIQKMVKIGFWSYNIQSSEITWSKEMFDIYESNQPNLRYHNIEIQPNNILNENNAKWQKISINKKYREESIEIKQELPSGKVKWLKEISEKIYNQTGELIRIDGISLDLTEINLCQEKVNKIIQEKDILIKELHHRVKNNMQVISSMLNLQSNLIHDTKLKSIFSDSQQRIKSMASVHDLLYQASDYSTINFKCYLENLITDVINSFKAPEQEIRLILKTDDIQFSLNKAIPLGLLINELVTNSIKHGFKNRNKCKIFIQLNCKQKTNFELIYKDDGIGFQKETKISDDNLGMMLLENLTDQLDGQLFRKTTFGKTCYKLLF
jgi:PAS domain S-box-containing protein